MKYRKSIDSKNTINPDKLGYVFSEKKEKNKKIKLSENWYKSILESLSRVNKEFAIGRK